MAQNSICVAFIDPIISPEFLGLELQKLGITVVAVFTLADLSEDEKKTRFHPECFNHVIYNDPSKPQSFSALIQELKQLNVDYIFYGYEGSICLTDKLSQIICPDYANDFQTAMRRFDKYEMQEALRAAGIPSLTQIHVASKTLQAEQINILNTWKFPVIIKLRKGSSSIGVKKCNSITEIQIFLEEANHVLLHGTEVDDYVIQECLVGVEYFVDTANLAGVDNIVGVFSYGKIIHKDQPIYRYVETIDPTQPEWKLCCDYALRVLKPLGLKNGFAHIELFLTDEGPRLVELNSRISGAAGFANRLATETLHSNQPLALWYALTKQAYQTPKKLINHGRLVLLQNWHPRKIHALNADVLKSLPSYIDHLSLKPPNTFLDAPKSLLDSVAFVLLVNRSRSQLLEDYNKLILLEKNNELF